MQMLNLSDIRWLHIELTTKCNARCPMCMRNYRGMTHNSGYPLIELSLNQIRHILPPNFLDQITHINLNGNLGDFGLATDAAEIVNYFLEHSKTHIQIETNASMRSPSWWAQLAHPRTTILFALDGLADVHDLYRQDTNWHRIIANAQALIQAGGRAIWKFILFDHNRHQLEQCRELSQELGFEDFIIRDHERNQGPVFDRDGNFSHWLGQPNLHQPDAKAMVQVHMTRWRTDGNLPSLDQDEKCDIKCKSIQMQEIYIAADGSVYPCCFLGFYPRTMQHPGNSQFRDWTIKNNALEWDMATCIEWFAKVESSWREQSIKAGRLYTCISCCGSVNR